MYSIKCAIKELGVMMKNLEKAGKKIIDVEDLYTFDKSGMLVRIEKEIIFQ